MSTTTRTITIEGIGPVPVSYGDEGTGQYVYVLLHGGAGPQSVTGFAGQLAGGGATGPARVITPVHPGFADTPRPAGLNSIAGLARLYVSLLGELGVTGATVVGNSIGGWIAAEMTLTGSTQITSAV